MAERQSSGEFSVDIALRPQERNGMLVQELQLLMTGISLGERLRLSHCMEGKWRSHSYHLSPVTISKRPHEL